VTSLQQDPRSNARLGLLVVVFALPALVTCTDNAAARAVARDRARFAQLVKGQPPFGPLHRSRVVVAQRVEDRILDLRKQAAPQEGVESLGLPGLFRILPPAVPLPQPTAERFRKVLSSPLSYEPSAYSTCVFSPVLALSFPSRDELMALLSDRCREVAFAQRDVLYGKWVLKQQAAEDLRVLTKEVLSVPGLGVEHR